MRPVESVGSDLDWAARARGSNSQPLSNNPYGLLDVGANALRFRVPRNLFQRWNESPIPPFKQLRKGLDVRWAGIEVVALICVLLRQADDIEQMLPDLFRVRRGLPLFAPALPPMGQWRGKRMPARLGWGLGLVGGMGDSRNRYRTGPGCPDRGSRNGSEFPG